MNALDLAAESAREPQHRSGGGDQGISGQAVLGADQRAALGADELRKMNAYWRAANYLSVGQIYLYDNPLLKEPLKLSRICAGPVLLGWGGGVPERAFLGERCDDPDTPDSSNDYYGVADNRIGVL